VVVPDATKLAQLVDVDEVVMVKETNAVPIVCSTPMLYWERGVGGVMKERGLGGWGKEGVTCPDVDK